MLHTYLTLFDVYSKHPLSTPVVRSRYPLGAVEVCNTSSGVHNYMSFAQLHVHNCSTYLKQRAEIGHMDMCIGSRAETIIPKISPIILFRNSCSMCPLFFKAYLLFLEILLLFQKQKKMAIFSEDTYTHYKSRSLYCNEVSIRSCRLAFFVSLNECFKRENTLSEAAEEGCTIKTFKAAIDQ